MLEKERNAIIKELHSPSNEFFIKFEIVRIAKNDVISEDVRQTGNYIYNQKVHSKMMHEEIWQKYCLSIAVAENGSEKLALGFSNRSAFLMHLSKYREALEDIDRAISFTKLNDSKFKFLCRKIKCLMYIDATDANKILQEAKSCYKNVNNKKGLVNLMKAAEKCVANGKKKLNIKNDKIDSPQLKKKTDDFSSVKCQENSKFGIHLTAARDIQPGEVIFVEKPYISTINLGKTHAFCSHCSIICWNMIPCDMCSWSLYCSETCKQDSWEQYHEIECPAYGYLIRDGIKQSYLDDILIVVLRLTIMECKKAGGIANLQDVVLSAEKKGKGNRLSCFLTDKKKLESQDFKCILSLNSDVNMNISSLLSNISLRILISLAKYTQFFGRKFYSNEYRNLSSNENVLFIGSLLLKLLKITYVCCFKIPNYNVVPLSSLYSKLREESFPRGYCISTVSSLINHDCDPNINKCFTDDNRLVLYALKPIKKDEQLFLSYVENFSKAVKTVRHSGLHFTCNCKACRENWQPLVLLSSTLFYEVESQDFIQRLFKTALEIDLFYKHKSEIKRILNKEQKSLLNDDLQCSEKMLMDIVKSVKKIAKKKIAYPSTISCLMTEIMSMVFEKLYAGSLQISDCPQKW